MRALICSFIYALRASLRLIFFILLSVLATLSYLIHRQFGGGAHQVPQAYHKACLWLFGIQVECEGERSQEQTVYLCNHLSWADIPVIGAFINGYFVAKAEVAGWPVLGWLARLHQTLFIERKRSALAQASEKLKEALRKGDSLILFPEGTNSLGPAPLPFKPALLEVLRSEEFSHVNVQPVALAFCGDEHERPLYGWGDDIDFLPHFLRFAGYSGFSLRLVFLPAFRSENMDRKEIAALAEERIRSTLNQ